LPVGGGGTRIALRIASSNLIGLFGFKNFGAGINPNFDTPNENCAESFDI